jgi:uncharacterized OB-fold protein
MTIDEMTKATDIEGFQPFWDAAASGELRFPVCLSCKKFHWYPMVRCPYCYGSDIEWKTIEPAGSVYSWTVVQRPFDTAFKNRTPYIVGLIEFSDAPGVRLITNLIEVDPRIIEFDMPVLPAFDLYDAAESRLMFRLKKMPTRSNQ